MKALQVICAELDDVSPDERGEIIDHLLETYVQGAILTTDSRLRFLNAMSERVHEMAQIPCVKDRKEMRCFPKDKCSFCRCREAIGVTFGPARKAAKSR